MRNRACIRFTLYPLCLLLLTNCGGGGGKPSSSSFIANEVLSDNQPLTSDELNIATRICYAYESKDNNFRATDYLKSKYNFYVNNRTCTNSFSYNIQLILNDLGDNGLVFNPVIATSNKFYSKVQTNQIGYLSKLCWKIKNNQTISNSVNSGTQVVQIHFYRDTLDSYILKYFEKIGTVYKATSSETFKVRTQYDYTNGNILGIDEYYSAQGLCNTTNTTTYDFNQKFLSRIK